MCLTVLLTTILMLPAYGQSTAQGGQPGVNLPPDHPALYLQFFYYHSSFADWLSSVKSKPGTNPADVDRKAADIFGLSPAGHQQLAAITMEVTQELRAIDKEMAAHANARAHYEQPPLNSMMKQYEAQRQAAVTRGIAKLQQSLPPNVWKATQAYINGAFRNSIRGR